MREIPRTSPVRFAHGADALQIAECRRFHVGDLFRVKVKSGHAAQQKIRGVRTAPGQSSQFRSGHSHVSRHALDFGLAA